MSVVTTSRVLVEKAMRFAIDAHGSQVRKYTGEPYWHHLQEVAEILKEHGVSEDSPFGAEILASAWLHDTVEDTEVTLVDLSREFGPTIALNVFYLTDISPNFVGANRAERKRIDAHHNAAGTWVSLTVKMADVISNTRSICQHDHKFAKVYLDEKFKLFQIIERSSNPNGVHPELFFRAKECVENGWVELSRLEAV